jgi:uncharacterized membrane protein YdjX (TVP38/TMEM64 family)
LVHRRRANITTGKVAYLSNSSPAPAHKSRWSLSRGAFLLFLLIWPVLIIWFLYAGWDVFKNWQQDATAFDAYKETLRNWLAAMGPLAPLGFILIQALQVVLAPIPGEATGFFGGFLFGALPGFLYSSLGLTLGSSLAFLVSRQLGSRIIEKLFRTESLDRFNSLFERNGVLVAFLLFLFPGAPKDYLCYLLGLSKLPFKAFLVLVAVGRMPATLLLSLQGAQVYQGHYWTFFILLGITVVAGGILILFREKFYRWLKSWGDSPEPPPP